MSLSDIAAVTRGNDDGDGWGGNGAWWIIVLSTETCHTNCRNFTIGSAPRPWTAWLRSKCLSTRTSRSNGRWRARF